MAWLPRDERLRNRFRLVLALGDGLTASFRSEWASALVCSVALRALVEGDPNLSPQDLARYAFDEAGRSLGRLADELTCDPTSSCPPGQFVSTWKYILRKGVLFQSTLTLAWLDRHFFHVAMVGDGGCVWRSYRARADGQPTEDRVLAQCDLDRHTVSAIGPADRNVREFDCWREEEAAGPFLCAAAHRRRGTRAGPQPGGAARRTGKNWNPQGAENASRLFIRRAVEQRPRSFDDNLTLAVIRSGGMP